MDINGTQSSAASVQWNDYNTTPPYVKYVERHAGRFNLVYADGHAGDMVKTQIVKVKTIPFWAN